MRLETTIIPTGAICANCTLVVKDHDAWIVDPGGDAPDIIAALQTADATPVAIVLTHGHFDHIGGVADLCQHYPALPVYISPEDAEWAFSDPRNAYPPYYTQQPTPKNLQAVLVDGMTLEVGQIAAQVIATPGHTPGGVVLRFSAPDQQDIMLTGDTLFAGSIGRTDLPGGNMIVLDRSLKKLAALPGDARVIPGHNEETTLETERRTNPYLRDDDEF